MGKIERRSSGPIKNGEETTLQKPGEMQEIFFGH
jgi:hypothetical protein